MFFIRTLFARLRRGDFRYKTILYQSPLFEHCIQALNKKHFILALQKHLIQTLDHTSLSKHFIKARYPSILSKHSIKQYFIQPLYPSTLPKHFIEALYPSTLSRQFQKHFRNTYQTSLYNLSIGVMYYEV